MFPLSFRRTHFAQCNQFVTLLYSSGLWRTTRRLNSSVHGKAPTIFTGFQLSQRAQNPSSYFSPPSLSLSLPLGSQQPTVLLKTRPPSTAQWQWQHSPRCKVACGVRELLPPASSLPTTNPSGSKRRFYLPLITEPAEILRSAALSSYQRLKKRNSPHES